jgi:UPF0755 protein
LGCLFLLATALGIWLYRDLYLGGESAAQEPVRVELPAGTSVKGAAELLEESGLLDGAWKLRLVHRLGGGEATVKAGRYEIQPGRSPSQLLDILVEGRVVTVAVTLPEGWTLEQSCAELSRTLGLDEAKLLGICRHPGRELIDSLSLPDSASLEGYLYPETYRFAEGVDAEEVVHTLTTHFLRAFDDSLRAQASEQGFTMHEVVTLASIIEAETGVSGERSKVAAVYRNRLAAGWKLEADPTVAYAAGISGEALTFGHLEMDSPYNTYRVKGLPPGPINSPGRASIVAALNPEPGFEAFYFVADGSGGHVFSRSWEEHRAAVRAYRARQRAAGKR